MPSSSICHFCGQPDAIQVGDQFICDACYIAKGSCCAGEETDEEHASISRVSSCEPSGDS